MEPNRSVGLCQLKAYFKEYVFALGLRLSLEYATGLTWAAASYAPRAWQLVDRRLQVSCR